MAAQYPLVIESGQLRQIGSSNWLEPARLGAAGLQGQVQFHNNDRLGAAATFVFDNALAQLQLFGDTDAVRLIMKGHSTQTSDLMQWRTSLNALLAKVTGAGVIDAQDFTIGGVTIAGGSVNIKQTEIDFGATPVAEASFIVVDAGVGPTSQIIGNVLYSAPTGKDLDELDMDAIDLKFGPGSGQFTIYAKGLEGPLHDKFIISYLIG